MGGGAFILHTLLNDASVCSTCDTRGTPHHMWYVCFHLQQSVSIAFLLWPAERNVYFKYAPEGSINNCPGSLPRVHIPIRFPSISLQSWLLSNMVLLWLVVGQSSSVRSAGSSRPEPLSRKSQQWKLKMLIVTCFTETSECVNTKRQKSDIW